MNNPTRPDVIENRRLDEIVDFDSFCLSHILMILRDFIDAFVLDPEYIKIMNIESQTIEKIRHCLSCCKYYAEGSYTSEHEEMAQAIWKYHDRTSWPDRAALRLAICCMSRKEDAMLDEYGADMFVGTLISIAYELGGENLCKNLGNFIENSPTTPKLGLDL